MYWENTSWQVPARAFEVFQGRASGVRVAQSPSPARGWLPTAHCKGRRAPLPTEPGRGPSAQPEPGCQLPKGRGRAAPCPAPAWPTAGSQECGQKARVDQVSWRICGGVLGPAHSAQDRDSSGALCCLQTSHRPGLHGPLRPRGNWLEGAGHCHLWPGLVAVPVWAGMAVGGQPHLLAVERCLLFALRALPGGLRPAGVLFC